MRATLLALAIASFSLFASNSSAQAISNGTFETWVIRKGLEVPFSWTTVDEGIESSPAGIFYSAVTSTKDLSSHAGTYAAKLETKDGGPLVSAAFGAIPGGLLLGTADYNSVTDILDERDISDIGGLPFTNRAANMQFYYKLSGTNALPDSAYALVALTRTRGGTTQTIASGSLRLLPATAYTLATIPLQYTSALTPDSIHIAFASGLAIRRTVGTTLFIDDVTMTGIVSSSKNPVLEASLTVYPNPSSNSEFRLVSPTKPTVATAPYTITDATGHVVRTAVAAPASLANGRPLELRGLPAGVYMLQLHTPEGLLTRKLLIP